MARWGTVMEMKWSSIAASDGVLYYDSIGDDSSNESLRDSASAIVSFVGRELLKHQAPKTWGTLRVELWADTARVVIFFRGGQAAVRANFQVNWPGLAAAWERFSQDPNEDVALIEPACERIVDALVSAFSQLPQRPYAIEFCQYEDVVGRLDRAG
ncbi:hypothetical protein [Sandaracinus amylolyticus]|uniref:hypothetical protein n=1 Tax=Sandaracinus amylolyticus TaxID=927083 RepID=UPI00069D9F05|nr:hypothetical protein [Sandaracinus amylolyticus]